MGVINLVHLMGKTAAKLEGTALESGKEREFKPWLEEFLRSGNNSNILDMYEGGAIEIPVNGTSKLLLKNSYPPELVDLAFHAWEFLRAALHDRSLIKRPQSPQGAIRELQGRYAPIAIQSSAMDKFMAIKPDRQNPLQALRQIEITNDQMKENGCGVEDKFVLFRFVELLPTEYNMTKHSLKVGQDMTRAEVVRQVSIRLSEFAGKKGGGGQEHANIADGSGRAHRSSGRGRGRGGGGGGGGGGSAKSGKPFNSGGAGGAGGGDGVKPKSGRCNLFGKRGHWRNECNTPGSERLTRCGHCLGWGHSTDKCPTETAVLAELVSDADSCENQAFMAEADLPGKCGVVEQSMNNSFHQVNCTATTGNDGDKSPYEMFHGSPTQLIPPADDTEGSTDGEGREDASSQGGRGEEDLMSEFNLDVTEVQGPEMLPERTTTPAAPGNGVLGSGTPPSPLSVGGDSGGGDDFPRPTSGGGSSSGSSRGRDTPSPRAAGANESAIIAEEALLSAAMQGDKGEATAKYDAAMAALLAEESAGEAARSTLGPPQPELSTTSPIGHNPSEVEALPLTYRDVKRSKYRVLWDEAIKEELGGQDETGTFSKVLDLPDGRKAVSSKWVFAWKVDENGLIADFKARLVARGFSQIPGVDFNLSSSPCPSTPSIKTVAAAATEKGMHMFHWDVMQAYTQAPLKDDVYLRFCDGCGDNSGNVSKVLRALYGLKQSGREWGYEAADILVSLGFEQCKADPCVFRKVVDAVVVRIIVIYVDIMYVGSEDNGKALHASLRDKLPIADLGDCHWCDGCAIKRDAKLGTTTLSQTSYIESMMDRLNITTTATIPTPHGADLGSKEDEDSHEVDLSLREAVVCMMWSATFTRPDLAAALNKVQKWTNAPNDKVSKAALQILAYLNGTRELGVTFTQGSGLDLEVYVDASYADEDADRRSTTGLAVTIGGTVVDHACKTQRVVALSTSEEEYIAAGEGVKEALFVRAVLSFVAPETSGAKIKVLEDNQGAIALVQNPRSSARSKHIDVRFHFIRELFRSGRISLEYIKTDDQHADLLTKVLSKAKLEYHRNALMSLPEYVY
eukprot:g10846.t1